MRYGMVIDLDRCTGCDTCTVSCKFENELPLGVNTVHVEKIGPYGTFPNIEQYWRPRQCQQCANPGCIEVCPTGASYRDEETGVVLVNEDACIGCQACLPACPFDARALEPKTNVIKKCVLCFQRHEDPTWVPMCVRNCCTGAIKFGDFDDPESDACKALEAAGEENVHSLHDEYDAQPLTRYILHEKIAAWQDQPERVYLRY